MMSRLKKCKKISATLLLLFLVACGEVPENDPYVYVGYGNDVRIVELDGVRCVVVDGSNGAVAVDCDWSDR